VKDTQAVITAKKTLDGQAPGIWRFKFRLLDADGQVIQIRENDADGNVTFDPITYTETGLYHYAIVEEEDGRQGIRYDGKTVLVTVEIRATGTGGDLTGQSFITYDTGQTEPPVFANSTVYMLPSTGGSGTVPLTVMALLIMGTGAALYMVSHKRRIGGTKKSNNR